MFLFRIFISGVVFLLVTILVNALAAGLRLTSWYTFLGTVQSAGFTGAITRLSWSSLLWLFVGYPLFLGTLVYFLRRLVV
jgi:hypothetical protein